MKTFYGALGIIDRRLENPLRLWDLCIDENKYFRGYDSETNEALYVIDHTILISVDLEHPGERSFTDYLCILFEDVNHEGEAKDYLYDLLSENPDLDSSECTLKHISYSIDYDTDTKSLTLCDEYYDDVLLEEYPSCLRRMKERKKDKIFVTLDDSHGFNIVHNFSHVEESFIHPSLMNKDKCPLDFVVVAELSDDRKASIEQLYQYSWKEDNGAEMFDVAGVYATAY